MAFLSSLSSLKILNTVCSGSINSALGANTVRWLGQVDTYNEDRLTDVAHKGH
jgi:hypothetical protein